MGPSTLSRVATRSWSIKLIGPTSYDTVKQVAQSISRS
jgi:hypothetical protein